MDAEEMMNLSSNATFDPTKVIYDHQRYYFIDFALLITSIVGILSDTIIIYVLVKFKALHTRTNTYLINFCVLNSMLLLISPALLDLFLSGKYFEAICYSDEMYILIMNSNHAFMCILLLDWYIITYKSFNVAARCRSSYKLVILTVWLILLSLIITVIFQCLAGVSAFALLMISGILFYFIAIIFIAFFHVMKFVNERTTSVVGVKWNLELLVVTYYLMCWLPNWLFIFFGVFLRFLPYNALSLGFVTFIFGNAYPISLLFLLYHKDKQFKACLDKLLSKKNATAEHVGEPSTQEEVSISLF